MNPRAAVAARSAGAVPAEAAGRLRKRYESLICDLLGEGLTGPAYQIADLAVADGLWAERLQRPIELHPTTRRCAFFEPDDFWFTSHLRLHWPRIRAEIEGIADPARAGFSTAGLDGSSVRGGLWHQLMLWDRGRRFDRACDLLPATAEAVAAIPEATVAGNGFVMVSWLQPGTWIAPHCGPTNAKARTHFCVRTDPEARIRVGDRERRWEEGASFTFDDSFEHEVWHKGTTPRVVLIVDTANPYLTEPATVVRRDQANRTDEMHGFMTAMQLERVVRTADGVEVTPNPAMTEFIRSYMDTRQIGVVELKGSRLAVTFAGDGSSR
ncbi:aspartate beta-hydroxylase [Micromonospora haikouensis]|uniref:Aspartate beta-hydroxylase n=1 Tax=Micromonospora haikouensis TaxID=686309 RepID=A0A1C4XHF9_9ACTN|nr:aspartyl/asparaginyl beta-hydroxylase domain-containing protein [Micromonospora haikouensis]SCF07834.1 aspartate beta-hydroxylase [Micromonospora haikouensis]